MITSAGSGDGKTTTVSNLAAAYGESGYSVLMLSFDLQRIRDRRRPRTTRNPGVTEFLAAESPIPLASLVMGTNVRGVSMVGIGSAARPPGGQLVDQQRLIDEARALADVVLIDTAPLLASSINRELATIVDGVVALCRGRPDDHRPGRTLRRPPRPDPRPGDRRGDDGRHGAGGFDVLRLLDAAPRQAVGDDARGR